MQKRSRALQRREDIAGYSFMLPSLVFFVGFVLIPMVICIYLSMTDSNMHMQGGGNFVGLKNFFDLAKDKVFLEALWNTFVIVFVSVPTVTVFSLWVSSVIYKLKMPVLSAFRCIFYLPVVTGSVAVTVVWKWIFDNYTGILNSVLKTTRVIEGNINWLGDEKYALGCIILILFTTSVGQPIVLYVSVYSVCHLSHRGGLNERFNDIFLFHAARHELLYGRTVHYLIYIREKSEYSHIVKPFDFISVIVRTFYIDVFRMYSVIERTDRYAACIGKYGHADIATAESAYSCRRLIIVYCENRHFWLPVCGRQIYHVAVAHNLHRTVAQLMQHSWVGTVETSFYRIFLEHQIIAFQFDICVRITL